MNDTPLNVSAGLPYSRRIRIRGGTSLWPTVDSFEVESELRVSQDARSRLKHTLTPYFSKNIEGADIVLDFKIPRSITRLLPSGFYSVVLSDTTHADERAIEILKGQLRVRPTVTGA